MENKHESRTAAKPIVLGPSEALLRKWLLLSPLFGLFPGVVAAGITFAATRQLAPCVLAFAVGFVAVALLAATYVSRYFPTIKYELTDQHLINSAGIFWKFRRTTPLEKVTNVDVRQGPLDRYFGIGEIWVFTPSTGALIPEARLRGVQKFNDARAMILSRAENLRQTPSSRGTPAEGGATDSREIIQLLTEILASLRKIESSSKDNADA